MSAARKRQTTTRRAVTMRHRVAIGMALEQAAEVVATAAAAADQVTRAVVLCCEALRRGKQILFCGNGGSAAQAAHLAAELSGRFYRQRPALRALALTENTAALTAIANDFGYERVFERQIEALAGRGDVLFALTTSGRSPNVRRALTAARKAGVTTIGLTGSGGRAFARQCDLAFVVPSTDTARIQEVHLVLGHVICAYVEAELF